MKNSYVLILLLLTGLSTSCSWLERTSRALVEDEEAADQKQATAARARRATVPKAQYDDLLARFDELNRKYESLKSGNPEPSQSLVNELQNTPVISNKGTSVETVDVFADNPVASNNMPEAPVADFSTEDVSGVLGQYRKALALKSSSATEALAIFRGLAKTAPAAIAARSKYQVGEILRSQGEFDVAMQVYEEVITKHAHSGVVLEALKGAVLCCDKLGQVQKKDQYQSLLKDIFQVGT